MFGNDRISPELLLLAGSSLAGGQTVGQQLGGIGTNVAPLLARQAEQRKQLEQQNKTLQYLKQTNPQLAAQVEAGMPVSEAWQQVVQAQQPKKPNLMNVGDGMIYNADSGQWITAPGSDQPKPTADYQNYQLSQQNPGYAEWMQQQQMLKNQPAIAEEYNWMKTQGFKGTAQEYQAWKASQSKTGLMVESDGNGGFRMVQGDVTNLPPKLTESQSKDINFLTRAKKAEDDLAPVESELTSFAQKRMTGLPFDMGNYMQSPGYQKAQQAGREILAIILRKDSGAAITDQEMDNYGKIYLPQPGDDAATIAAKRQSRATAINALQAGLGPLVPKDAAATPDTGVVPYTDFFK
jgi:hypothetical protein